MTDSVSVVAAVQRDLGAIGEVAPDLASSGIAAAALALAAEIDDPNNSATSKSMCARALREALDRLRELMPPAKERNKLDDLASRRTKRLEGRSAS